MFLAACLICEIEGMKAENQRRLDNGAALAYGEEAFQNLKRDYECRRLKCMNAH